MLPSLEQMAILSVIGEPSEIVRVVGPETAPEHQFLAAPHYLQGVNLEPGDSLDRLKNILPIWGPI